jgi:hypothetical protein
VSNQFCVKLAGAPTQEDVMRREKTPNELGYVHGMGSVDDAPAPRFEIRSETPAPITNLHGIPNGVVDQIIAAVEAEDTVDLLELDQRRYEMERAMISAEKDRLIEEMAAVIDRVFEAVMYVPTQPNTTAITTARLIARNPAVGVDSACLMSARYRKTGSYVASTTMADVLAFKP